MRKTVFAVLLLVLAITASANEGFNLPELHVIKTATLGPCYSCRETVDFMKGYQNTALFLSDYSKRRNSPDLLYNGAPGGAPDYFESSTAGDDMALIADLGTNVELEKLSAHLAFNLRNVHSFPAYTKFARVAPVEKNHTYAVLLNKREIRGLFIFRVIDHVPNERVEIRYAVKEYQVLDVKASSTGFSWERENH